MTIPDPDNIWPELESIGVDEVRKRLAMGIYAQHKIPMIEEWLRQKDHAQEKNSEEESGKNFSTQQVTKVDKFFKYLQNHQPFSYLISAGLIVIYLANFTDSASRLISQITHWRKAASLSTLPGETGWIFAGYFDIQRQTFIEGPYISIVSSSTRGNRRYVEIGDKIRLNVSREIHIVDFETTRASKKLMSPIVKGVISKSDKTGLVLPAETELVVRDVSEGHWPDNNNAALWLRVVDTPK